MEHWPRIDKTQDRNEHDMAEVGVARKKRIKRAGHGKNELSHYLVSIFRPLRRSLPFMLGQATILYLTP